MNGILLGGIVCIGRQLRTIFMLCLAEHKSRKTATFREQKEKKKREKHKLKLIDLVLNKMNEYTPYLLLRHKHRRLINYPCDTFIVWRGRQ